MFASLDVVHQRITEFYHHQLDNISICGLGAGSNYSVVLTNGGSAWAFGGGEDGRTCQPSEAPTLEPAIVLVARPIHEGMVANAFRIHVNEATAFKNCEVGAFVSEIERGARVVFANQVIPTEFTGVRFRYRSWSRGGAIIIRADSEEGPVLTAAFVRNTQPDAHTDPEWQLFESPSEKRVDTRPHTIILMFEDPDCCELEWFEFFVSK